jgi:hypothetical protein
LQHRFGDRRFQIHPGANRGPHALDVNILNMAAVFTQVQSDEICAGCLRQFRRLQRIRIRCAARLAQGRNVIDIHAEEHS